MDPSGRRSSPPGRVSTFGFGGTISMWCSKPMRASRWRPPSPRPATGRPSCSRGRPPIAAGCLAIWIAWRHGYPRASVPAPRPGARLAGRLGTPATATTLAMVTTSHADLIAKLGLARDGMRGGSPAVADPRGVYFAERPGLSGQKVAFLFPGQGAQTVGMLGELAIHFEEVRRAYEEFDAAILALGHEPIGPRSFLLPSSTRQHAGGRTRPCKRPRSRSRRSGRRASAC